jgi:hypothetical protein
LEHFVASTISNKKPPSIHRQVVTPCQYRGRHDQACEESEIVREYLEGYFEAGVDLTYDVARDKELQ